MQKNTFRKSKIQTVLSELIRSRQNFDYLHRLVANVWKVLTTQSDRAVDRVVDVDDTDLQQAFCQALNALYPELGYFAASTAIVQEVMRLCGEERLMEFFASQGSDLPPILPALSQIVFDHAIEACVKSLLQQISPIVAQKRKILCVGCETAILDVLVKRFKNVHFHVVLHSPEADANRIESNYGTNFTAHESTDVPLIFGADSMLLAFGYGVASRRFFTYPIFHSVLTADSRLCFAKIVLAGLCTEKNFFRYPSELSEVSVNVMSHIFLS